MDTNKKQHLSPEQKLALSQKVLDLIYAEYPLDRYEGQVEAMALAGHADIGVIGMRRLFGAD